MRFFIYSLNDVMKNNERGKEELHPKILATSKNLDQNIEEIRFSSKLMFWEHTHYFNETVFVV